MNTIKRILPSLAVLAMLLGAHGAWAWPSCQDIFATTYPNSLTDDLGDCQTCHQSSGGGGTFNVYGEHLLTNGASGAGFSCTDIDFPAALLAVETLDSDGEGNSNLSEIDADTQPGWCDVNQATGCTNSAGTPPNVALDPAPLPPPTNNAPIADAGGPYAGEAGTTLIQFDGSGSSDPDGDAITFAWEFGDDSGSTEMMPTHTYASAGNFQVTLVVNDGHVDSDAATAEAVITAPAANLAPIADPGGPYAGEPGQTITFDGSASADPNDDVLTYSWDFGDSATGTGVAPTHSYAANGTYRVSLVVSDGSLDSEIATTTAEISTRLVNDDGEALYSTNCLGCHGDPWAGPAVDDTLPGLRRVAGARSCNINGSIFGTSVFPGGVPEMQFLQALTVAEIDLLSDYLNSQDTDGERRYVTTCAGCHGNDGSGGRTREDVHGESADETWEAIADESEMHYLACMPRSDIDQIEDFLAGFDDDFDDDGIRDDDDDDDDNDGIHDDDDDDDDNDGVSDDDEREDGTDPCDDDSDDDGLNDGDERDHGTDPKDPDTDDDGKSDGEEVHVLGTNPLVADSAVADGGSGGGSPSVPLLVLLALTAMRRRTT
jgi:MYXO-CTERM domain-containing protein